MKYRRYYPRGSKQKYVHSDEQFEEIVKKIGFEAAIELDNACIELVPETDKEHQELFFESCDRVLRNTRFYLDNLDKIATFTVRIKKIFPKSKENRYFPKHL